MDTEKGRGFSLALTSMTIALAAMALVACGSSGDDGAGSEAAAAARPTAAPTSRPTETQPSASPTATATAEAANAQPTTAPTETPSPEPATAVPRTRTTGEVDGITFVVGEGSEATFTVTEQLARLPLPNDAVIRTTALSGEVHMDGRDSFIEIDLQQMRSDSSFRDRYIRSTMFGRDPIGVFTVKGLDRLPEGFRDGEVVTGQVHGELLIRGVTAPLTFDVEARDDGDVVHILGRTSFTWDELQIPKPSARSVISVEDEVTVEVLLSVTPRMSTGS